VQAGHLRGDLRTGVATPPERALLDRLWLALKASDLHGAVGIVEDALTGWSPAPAKEREAVLPELGLDDAPVHYNNAEASAWLSGYGHARAALAQSPEPRAANPEQPATDKETK
jgi:hypothetical protein